MTDNTYTCEWCEGTFTKGRADDDALAEYHDTFPESVKRHDETAVICHDCWLDFMEWAKREGVQL
jgi:hypothetical protein